MVLQKNCNVYLGTLFSTQWFWKNMFQYLVAIAKLLLFLLALLCCCPAPRSGNCPPMLRGNAGVPEICFSKVPHAVHSWVLHPQKLMAEAGTWKKSLWKSVYVNQQFVVGSKSQMLNVWYIICLHLPLADPCRTMLFPCLQHLCFVFLELRQSIWYVCRGFCTRVGVIKWDPFRVDQTSCKSMIILNDLPET